MREAYYVFRRDIKRFYRSWGAYLLYFSFLMLTSLWVYRIDNFLVRNRADFTSYFSIFPYILSVIIPALTMGILAEEKNRGTYELLLTQGFSVYSLAVGKYAAVLVQITVMIILTIPVPLSLVSLGIFDPGRILARYIGVLLFSSTLASLGLYISALCKKQVQAFILSLLMLLIAALPRAVLSISAGGGTAAEVLRIVSPWYHLTSFSKGLLDSRDLVYYGATTVFFIFLTIRRINLERWS
ncbi:MAG: ABC transporter permease [Spirochaetes bacterium]|nr:MAG: ABC transporter permease [Spirochaetota bacterium]